MTPTGYAAIRRCVGWSATARSRALPASASQMGRFETKWLSRPENLAALADLPGQWIDKVHQRRPPRIVVLDMDSSESPTYGEQEGSAYNGHFGCTCYHPLFVFNQLGDVERCALRSGNVHSADGWRAVLEPVNQHRSGTPERRRHRALLSLIGFTFRVGSYRRRSGPPSTAFSSKRSGSYRRGKRGPTSVLVTGNILMWRLSGKYGEITPQICQARNFAAMITAAQCRSARTLLGWSLNKLARAASVPADVIDNFEMERQRPDAATIGALQRAFEDVGVEFLPDDDVRIRAATPPDS